MMTEEEVRQLLVETKAVLEGHFLLTSGLHSPLPSLIRWITATLMTRPSWEIPVPMDL